MCWIFWIDALRGKTVLNKSIFKLQTIETASTVYRQHVLPNRTDTTKSTRDATHSQGGVIIIFINPPRGEQIHEKRSSALCQGDKSCTIRVGTNISLYPFFSSSCETERVSSGMKTRACRPLPLLTGYEIKVLYLSSVADRVLWNGIGRFVDKIKCEGGVRCVSSIRREKINSQTINISLDIVKFVMILFEHTLKGSLNMLRVRVLSVTNVYHIWSTFVCMVLLQRCCLGGISVFTFMPKESLMDLWLFSD